MALTRITKGVIKPNENYDTHNINSTGIVTAIGLDVNGNGDISGNLSVGGVLTYEDVTSIDSVGIITAQKDIHVGAGVSAVGVGTFKGGLDVDGNGDISGNLDIHGDLDVDGHTNLDNVSIAGVATITSSTYPLNVHADTVYQGILVNGNNAPTIGFNVGNNATPSWKLGLHGGSHLNFALSTGTGNSNKLVIQDASNGGRGIFSGDWYATNLSMAGNLYHDGDTDTTLSFVPAGDIIDLKTGGSTRLRVENSGVIVTGVSTFSSNIDANGDLDVDGHTNLDNVSIAGVTTFAQKINLSDNFIRNCRGFNSGNEQARIVVKAGDNSAGGGLRIVEYYNDDTTLFSSEIANFYTNGIELKENVSITGDLTIPDSIIHSGDTNTKIRFPAADTIQFETSGSSRLKIDDNGKVLIATTTTSEAHANQDELIIGSTSDDANHGITIVTPSSKYGTVAFSDGSSGTSQGLLEYNHSGDYFRIYTGGTGEKFRITSAGKIGVNYAGNPPAETMMISSGDSTTGLSLSHLSGGNRYGFRLSTIGGTNKGLIISPFFNAGYTEALRINSNGDVTTTGQASFSRQNAGFTARAGDAVSITRASGTPLEINRTGSDGQMISLYDDNTQEAAISISGGSLQFGTPNSNNARLTITSGGKIGINETAPFADVDISASVEDTDNSSLAAHGIRLHHVGAANEEVIPITAGFVTQQARARAGIGFISKTISGADGMGGAIGFYTRNTADGHALYRADERARVTETGVLLVGHTSSPTSDSDKLQVISTSSGTGINLFNYSASNYGNQIAFMKSRSNSIEGNTILQSGDRIGELNFYGNDGSGRSLGAQISVRISGTPGNDNTPAAMYFMNGTNQSMSTRLSILPAGTVGISKNGWASSDNSFGLTVHTGSTSETGPVGDGIMIVSQQNNGNQNSSTGKLMFCGHAQTNGPFLYGDNTAAYGKKDLVFHTHSTANSYSTQLEETARFTYGGKFGLGTGTAVDSLMHIQGNSDNGDEACMLTIEDEDTTAGSRIPSIVFKGNGTQQHRIRGTDLGGLTFADSGNNVRFIVSNGAEAGAAQLGRDSRGWATFRHSDHQGLRTHIRQHYAPGNAVSTYDILRIRRHWWGWGTYKIRLKALYYYGSHETTYYVNGHGSGGDNYSIVKETAHNNDYSAATVTKSAGSSSSPGTNTTYFIDVRVNVPNYMYLIVYIEAYSSQYSTDPTNMGADSYCLL